MPASYLQELRKRGAMIPVQSVQKSSELSPLHTFAPRLRPWLPISFAQHGFNEMGNGEAEVMLGAQSSILHLRMSDEGAECGLVACGERGDLLGQVVGQAVAVVGVQEGLA